MNRRVILSLAIIASLCFSVNAAKPPKAGPPSKPPVAPPVMPPVMPPEAPEEPEAPEAPEEPITCPPEILNYWVSQSCAWSTYYSCPLVDYYVFANFEVEPTDKWQHVCIAEAAVATQERCSTVFNWGNGLCGQFDWGYGCNLYFYCK